MKRSAPLKRKTLLRKTRLRQVGARKRREEVELARFRRLVADRADGQCQVLLVDRCHETNATLRAMPFEAHHIQPRSRGGTHDPENGLWVCASCHRWIHEHPKQAREMGWTK